MNLQSWIGRTETSTDVITPTPYAALSATLDREPRRPPGGTPLPPLWHWLYFLPLYKQSEVGPDGHALRGDFLPPVPLPRRMWAGSEFDFRQPLYVGDQVTRVSTITDIKEKTGRSGSLVFVKVRHELRRSAKSAPAITETHDIVYREAARPGVDVPTPAAAPDAAWERKIVPDAVLLFRYSALTFNGHRIHYDRRYVTEVESYPGLVVHGPLLATLLLDLLHEHRPGAAVVRFSFRASSPLFDTDPFFVCGAPGSDTNTVRLWAKDHRGGLAMDATAVMG
ncbi:MAG TPA: MaoC family dehydratase N-terminal domain-containing protein [Casimicrobiaceae bacterium]|jgi:3-methylfumaryl-CoA hydratase